MPIRRKNFAVGIGESLDFQAKYVARDDNDPSILNDVDLTNYSPSFLVYKDIYDLLLLTEGSGIISSPEDGVISIFATPQQIEGIGVGTVDYKLFLTANYDETEVDEIMAGKIQVFS